MTYFMFNYRRLDRGKLSANYPQIKGCTGQSHSERIRIGTRNTRVTCWNVMLQRYQDFGSQASFPGGILRYFGFTPGGVVNA